MNQKIAVLRGVEQDQERENMMANFFDDINDFMTARHNYKKHMCYRWVNKVDAHCYKFSLTLGFRHDNSVAISSIRFRQKRRGHCSALIQFIDHISHNYSIPYIEFVSVMSEPMKNFVIKNNFLNREGYFSPIEKQEMPSYNWYRTTPFGLKYKCS